MSEPSADPQPPAPDGPPSTVADSWMSRHPAAIYSLARVVLFVVPFAGLYFVADFFTALLIAFLFSAIASIFLLRRQREALSVSIATRAERATQKMADRAAVEDEWDDAQRGEGSGKHAD
ncbi:MAG: DUF4229 domain-containing protein [Actinomycetia bacterium]|nr:DUF4229 domain-containing protein [Actinomycetes bacterium]